MLEGYIFLVSRLNIKLNRSHIEILIFNKIEKNTWLRLVYIAKKKYLLNSSSLYKGYIFFWKHQIRWVIFVYRNSSIINRIRQKYSKTCL